ncbi:MAG: cell wall biosynthesis glycosyltransferase [Acidobacteria bacterium OLB17]|nr:MAG: cell wall biosynthesis glycosyltransferase [Acidobacteria bacterium OLB17]MCZ2390566.1 glycosyltransferase family 2 protein [Acidobacteriota bacterium]
MFTFIFVTIMRTPNEKAAFVAVPSYNHRPFVEECLRSIFRQTLPPAKLLVIDDGSRDGSAEAIEEVLRDAPFEAELIARENRGLSATLNQALSQADTPFFAYLGSDDLWLPNFLEEQIGLLDVRKEAALAFSHVYVIDGEGDIFDRTDKWAEFADGDMLPTLMTGGIFSSPGVVYRREFLGDAAWNERSKLEDYELYLRLAAKHEFARNTKLLAAWRQHGSNTSDDFALMVEEWLAAQERLRGELPYSDEEFEAFRTKLRYAAARHFNRTGSRRLAARAMWQNRKGASSVTEKALDAIRVAAPRRLFDAQRKRRRDSAKRRYGNISELL